ncbi:MAG TPA: amino acid ABC transporter permease [Aggregatilineaceae bacterium]|nr:amino acid ABC transporter permease [Aggregatilineaceae bacterium]
MSQDRELPDEIQPVQPMPPQHSGEVYDDLQFEQKGPADRLINWAAGLPWWAIILAVVAIAVIYSMFTSAAYQDVLRALTDNPQVSTDDLFDVVQVVGEPQMVVGRYVGESQDSVSTVLTALLDDVIDSELVQRSGFIVREAPESITIQTDGERVTIPRQRITQMEPPDAGMGDNVSIEYIERVTIAGTLTARDDETLTIRTVDEEIETFDTDRILSEETTTTPDGDTLVTIEREGRRYRGLLTALSQTGVSLQSEDGIPAEIRRADIDFLYIPTLTIALNAEAAERTVAEGDEVRIGFVEGTDITEALAQLDALEDVPVPLRYGDGAARVALIGYPDVAAVMEATASGEVDATLYLSSGEDRLAVAEWVDDNPEAGVILPTPPRECQRHCTVTVKLVDDVVEGRVVERTEDSISVQTVAPEYLVIDRDQIVENRRTEPGVCALNNLRGCNAGIFLTLRVTFLAYAMALLIGLIVGLMRVQKNPVLYAFSTLYVEVVRGIPLLVILLYAGFVVSPWLRDNTPLQLSDEWEAILGLSFGYGAFIAEIFRAGIQSISRGQMEAARSLGMSYPQAMRHVVLPQAVRVVLPPLGNDFISMLKDSALISVLALPDLLQLGRLYISRTFRAFEGYNTVALLYLLMTLFLSLLVRIIERRSRLPG